MISKNTLRTILDDTDSRPGRIFALAIQLLIVVSLITFTLDTLPDLSAGMRALLGDIELFTISVFTAEYVGRVIIAEKKAAFIFSFYGLVDLLAVLPFYLSSGLDLRTLRALRLLRLIRILKLFRYSRAIDRFRRALSIIKEELILFGFIAVIMLYLSAVGIYYFENAAQPDQFRSVIHSLWWAITTLTTVGYGDMFPVTAGGKFFTFLVLMVGLGIVAVPTGLIASALSQTRKEDAGES